MKKYRLLSGAVAAALVASMATVPALAADFKDTDNHWAKDAINRWSDYGVVKGSNGEFRPDSAMTRAEFAQVIANLLHLPDASSSVSFNDVADTDWFASAIKSCAAAGILKGDGTNANPTAAITREEAMVMLGRALGVAEETGSLNYSDANQVASWAEGFVKAMTDKGYVHGVGANTLAPKNNINRASLMTIVDNAIKAYANKANSSVTAASEGITLVVEPGVTVSGTANDLVVAGGAKGGTTAVTDGSKVTDTLTVTTQNATVVLKSKSSAENAVLTANATNSKIVVENGSTIGTVAVNANGAKLEGAGKVTSATVNANNVTFDIAGTNLSVGSGANGTTSFNTKWTAGQKGITKKPSSGGGGSSTSYNFISDLTDGKAQLTENVTVDATKLAAALAQDTTIDLNGKTLTVNAADGKALAVNKALTISNGTVNGTGIQFVTALFDVKSSLTLDKVNMTSNGSVVMVGANATVSIEGGSLTTTGDGVYCIATNAIDSKASVGGITVKNCTLTTTAADSCAFMLNIGGKATLDGCTINGQRQGVVVRSGSVDIKSCKIGKTSEQWNETNKWASGNEVADGSVVVGANGVYGPVGKVSIDSATTVDGRIIKAKGANLVNNTSKLALEWSIS